MSDNKEVEAEVDAEALMRAIRAALSELDSRDLPPEGVTKAFAMTTATLWLAHYGDDWRKMLVEYLNDPETVARAEAGVAEAFGSAQ